MKYTSVISIPLNYDSSEVDAFHLVWIFRPDEKIICRQEVSFVSVVASRLYTSMHNTHTRKCSFPLISPKPHVRRHASTPRIINCVWSSYIIGVNTADTSSLIHRQNILKMFVACPCVVTFRLITSCRLKFDAMLLHLPHAGGNETN